MLLLLLNVVASVHSKVCVIIIIVMFVAADEKYCFIRYTVAEEYAEIPNHHSMTLQNLNCNY